MSKVERYIIRGRRPLSKEEIERAVSFYAGILAPPENIVVLDGVIDVDGMTAVGAHPRLSNYILLTPLSDEETLFHEWIHLIGFGEVMATTLGRIMYNRYISGSRPIFYRDVKYEVAPPEFSTRELVSLLGLEPEFIGMPEVRRYRLVRPPALRRLHLI